MTGLGQEGEADQRSPSVFLERQSYRRRRLMDAARLMPVLGALLFAVPLLWPAAGDPGGAAPMPTSGAILYIFTVWAVLILGNVWFGRLTRGWSGGGPGAGSGRGEEADEATMRQDARGAGVRWPR